jgi:hypothetical protein
VQERYRSAADLIRDLSACHTMMTSPVTVVRQTSRARMSPAVLGLAAVIVAGLISVPAIWWFQQRAAARELDEAISDATALADRDDNFAAGLPSHGGG